MRFKKIWVGTSAKACAGNRQRALSLPGSSHNLWVSTCRRGSDFQGIVNREEGAKAADSSSFWISGREKSAEDAGASMTGADQWPSKQSGEFAGLNSGLQEAALRETTLSANDTARSSKELRAV
jgi:hypothetical protein